MAFKYMIGSINTKLFVGGLNYNTSDQTLSEFFGKFGNVAECVVMKFPDSGESRGFGFVTFSSEQEVEWCLSSLPLSLDGKNVDVKRAEAPTRDGTKVGGGVRDGVKRKGGDASCKVFVGGLNYNTGEDMLKQVFSRYGKVNDWIIMKFPDSGESRGFGFVTFSSADEVERCLINQPIIVDGKSVDIKKAEPPSARAPVNNKQTKPMSRFKYQKDKESCIDNKLPRGGGTMADICNGGNQCGGGFGNNCGHDTFSTIASQVVAMTTNQHKPVKEEVQDYSKYYQEYSKWYASWRQYNEYLQQGGGSSAQPPLPPGERPKTPPQSTIKPSIRAEPQYNQECFTGSKEGSSSDQGQTSQYSSSSDIQGHPSHYKEGSSYGQGQHSQYSSSNGQGQHSQYSSSNDQGHPSQYREGSSNDQGHPSQYSEGSYSDEGKPSRYSDQAQPSRYRGQHQAQQTADEYNHYSSNQQQPQTGDEYNQGHPSQYRGQHQPQNGDQYNQYHEGGRGNAGQEANKKQQRKRRNQSPPSWVPQFNQSGPQSNNDCSSYNNDGSNYNNDGPTYNSGRRNFNSDGRNYNNSDRRSNSNNGNNYSNNSINYSNGSNSDYNGHHSVEPERNEFYQQNLETQKRKKMRMSS